MIAILVSKFSSTVILHTRVNHDITHDHYSTIYTLLFYKSARVFKSVLSLFPSRLQIKPKTFFPSSSISLPWINKKQTLFSSSANTLKKNAEHGVKMLKIQIQRFLLL